MTPSHFVILLKGNLLQIYSSLEVILGHFVFTKFGVVEFSRINFTKFGVLEFFWNCQNSICFGPFAGGGRFGLFFGSVGSDLN